MVHELIVAVCSSLLQLWFLTLSCSRSYEVGMTKGLPQGSQSRTHVERSPQQRGRVRAAAKGLRSPKAWSGVCRRRWCSAGRAAMAGRAEVWDGPGAASRSVVCTHIPLQRRPPRSGLRDRWAPRGAGWQPGRRALLRPEAVVVLLFDFCKGFDCDAQEINWLHPFRSTGKLVRNHERHSIHC